MIENTRTKKTNTTVNKQTNKHETKQKNHQTNKQNQPTKALTEPTLFPPPTELQTRRKPTSTTKQMDIDAILLGSSIVKHVKGRNVKRRSGKFLKICSYPGADTEKVHDHAQVELKYSAPKTAIIHAGGNDLAYGVRADDAVNNIASLGCELRNKGVSNIAISGMTPRSRLKWDIININHLLKHTRKFNNFHFIDNSNISFF